MAIANPSWLTIDRTNDTPDSAFGMSSTGVPCCAMTGIKGNTRPTPIATKNKEKERTRRVKKSKKKKKKEARNAILAAFIIEMMARPPPGSPDIGFTMMPRLSLLSPSRYSLSAKKKRREGKRREEKKREGETALVNSMSCFDVRWPIHAMFSLFLKKNVREDTKYTAIKWSQKERANYKRDTTLTSNAKIDNRHPIVGIVFQEAQHDDAK